MSQHTRIKRCIQKKHYMQILKNFLLLLLLQLFILVSYSQQRPSMTWFNEPDSWKHENGKLTFFTTAKTDYWRISH